MDLQPALLREGALRLHAQAQGIILKWTAGMAVVGCVAGFALMGATKSGAAIGGGPGGGGVPVVPLVGTLAAGAIGLAIGRERAFWVRLRVQELLTLAELEERTRGR